MGYVFFIFHKGIVFNSPDFVGAMVQTGVKNVRSLCPILSLFFGHSWRGLQMSQFCLFIKGFSFYINFLLTMFDYLHDYCINTCIEMPDALTGILTSDNPGDLCLITGCIYSATSHGDHVDWRSKISARATDLDKLKGSCDIFPAAQTTGSLK